MACPVCPAAGWLGGWFGGYFGIEPPANPGGRILSAAITANLIGITVIALKAIFDISLCVGGGFTLANIVRVGSKALVMGVIYSIGVNYLLNRYVFPSSCENSQESDLLNEDSQSEGVAKTPPCCCKKLQEEVE